MEHMSKQSPHWNRIGTRTCPSFMFFLFSFYTDHHKSTINMMKIISYWTNLWNPTHDSSNKKKLSHLLCTNEKESLSRPTFNCSSNKSARSSPKALRCIEVRRKCSGLHSKGKRKSTIFIHFDEFSSCKPLFWMGNSNGQVSNNFVFSPCHFKHMSLPYESKLGGGKWATWRNDHQPLKTISWLHGYILLITMLNLHNKNILHDKPSLCCNTTTVTHTHIATNTKTSFIMKLP